MSARLTRERPLVRSQVRPSRPSSSAGMSAPFTSGRSQVRALPWPLTARSSAGSERPAPTGEAARSTRAARIGKDQPTAGAGRGLENRRAHLAPWEFDPPSFRFGAVMYRPHSELLTRPSGFDSYRLHLCPGRLLAQTPLCRRGDRSSILRRGARPFLSQLVQRQDAALLRRSWEFESLAGSSHARLG